MLVDRLHSGFIRLLYRVLAPGHPRGSTDMHAVMETDDGDTLWIHTHGLGKFGLSEIELVGVPNALRGYAHGILFDIMGYMKAEKAIAPDEHFGGTLVHDEQRVLHYATSRSIERRDDPEHDGFLRFVDYGCSAESGFPRRLFATHIASFADRERSPQGRERLARLSLETYDGSPREWLEEAEIELNPGNWLAWDVLGHALFDQGNEVEGERCFREVLERCPAAALKLHDIYRDAIAAGALPPPESDLRSRFWSSLDVESLHEAVASRKGS